MNNLDTPYKPISCELHSEYELAIMRKNKLCLTWNEDGNSKTRTNLTPVDVITKDKAEFLIIKTEVQDEIFIRLDHITEMHVIN